MMKEKEGQAQSVQPLKPADFERMKVLGEVQLSPDGQKAFYDVSFINSDKNIYQGQIWQIDVASKESRQLTSGTKRDSLPRLSPNGKKLAFLSNRGEDNKNQVYLLNLEQSGEAEQLTKFQNPVTSMVWSPDNNYLVVTVETPDDKEKAAMWYNPEKPEERKERENREADEKKNGGNLVTFNQAHMRADGRRTLLPEDAHSQLWLIDTSPASLPRQLTFGSYGVSQPCFSPDGKQIVFSSTRDDQQKDFTSISDLWVINVFEEKSSEPTKLTVSRGPATSPAWSPDGKRIAFVGHTNPKDGSFLEQTRVWVLELDGNSKKAKGEPVCLTANLDLPVANLLNTDVRTSTELPLIWNKESSEVFFGACDAGSMHIFDVSVNSEKEPELVVAGERHIYAFNYAPEVGKLAFASCDPANPGDLFIQTISDKSGNSLQQLTNLNQSWLSEYYLATPETIKVRSLDKSVEVEGWLLKPPGFDASKKYPMVVAVHGGPHTAYGNSFYYEFQVLAGQGQVVLFTNPRGSVGYGYDFAGAIRNDWGHLDYDDIIASVDYVIEKGYVDPARLGIEGGSYGGYMTNWVISHTDRFKAALSERCVSNLVTMYTLSDISFRFVESEFEGNIWTNPRIWECSPMAHVNKVNTPVLLLHSEMDFRCPIEQAEEFFFALKRLGREVTLVRTPGEDHNLSRNGSPAHRIERLNRIAGWFASKL